MTGGSCGGIVERFIKISWDVVEENGEEIERGKNE